MTSSISRKSTTALPQVVLPLPEGQTALPMVLRPLAARQNALPQVVRPLPEDQTRPAAGGSSLASTPNPPCLWCFVPWRLARTALPVVQGTIITRPRLASKPKPPCPRWFVLWRLAKPPCLGIWIGNHSQKPPPRHESSRPTSACSGRAGSLVFQIPCHLPPAADAWELGGTLSQPCYQESC